MVSGQEFEYDKLHPAHLVKHSCPQLMELYGLRSGEIDNPRNGLLLLDSIEKAFDRMDVCFLYDPIKQILVFKVLNPQLRDKDLLPPRNRSNRHCSTVEGRTFQEVDGHQLILPFDKYPYRRILSVHAKFAYARALENEWIKNDETLESYFNISDAGFNEPECIRDLTFREINFKQVMSVL
jgi:hypothetical protein